MLPFILFLATAVAGILEVEILDVGQGDSILIKTPAGKLVLIDGGTGTGRTTIEHLTTRNVQEINLMVATHAHADHIGGLDEVLEDITVKNFLDSGLPHTTESYRKVMKLVEEKEITYIEGKNGRKFRLDDGIVLDVLHPQDLYLKNTRSDLNSNSVVIRLTHGDNCMLFTGDAEEPTESALIQKGLEPCGVLKVAHHGSNHSSSDRFLNAVQPDIALISCGVDNKYGHPGEETLEKLHRIGAQVYRTDQLGTIKVISDGKLVTIESERPFSAEPITTSSKTHSSQKSSSKDNKNSHKSTTSSKEIQGNPNGFDINTASVTQLQSISGIGPSKAQAIIQYREENGPFTTFSDVENVKGIGPSTVQKIQAASFIQ